MKAMKMAKKVFKNAHFGQPSSIGKEALFKNSQNSFRPPFFPPEACLFDLNATSSRTKCSTRMQLSSRGWWAACGRPVGRHAFIDFRCHEHSHRAYVFESGPKKRSRLRRRSIRILCPRLKRCDRARQERGNCSYDDEVRTRIMHVAPTNTNRAFDGLSSTRLAHLLLRCRV